MYSVFYKDESITIIVSIPVPLGLEIATWPKAYESEYAGDNDDCLCPKWLELYLQTHPSFYCSPPDVTFMHNVSKCVALGAISHAVGVRSHDSGRQQLT